LSFLGHEFATIAGVLLPPSRGVPNRNSPEPGPFFSCRTKLACSHTAPPVLFALLSRTLLFPPFFFCFRSLHVAASPREVFSLPGSVHEVSTGPFVVASGAGSRRVAVALTPFFRARFWRCFFGHPLGSVNSLPLPPRPVLVLATATGHAPILTGSLSSLPL